MSTYVVTGAASGIGAATKERLQSDGHRVIGIDLHSADIEVDLGTSAGVQHAVTAVGQLTDAVDGFAPIAGLAPAGDRAGRLLVAVNYFGAIELLEGLRPLLAAGTDPSVVLLSSNSTTTQPHWPTELAEACLAGDREAAYAIADGFGDYSAVQAYPASKAALAYYARTRSADYIKDGIRLNAVAPGFIDTPMTQAGREDPLIAQGMDAYVASIPAGRGGRPEEVSSLISYLLGPGSTYVVGSVLFVDGGLDAAARGMDWPTVWRPARSPHTP